MTDFLIMDDELDELAESSEPEQSFDEPVGDAEPQADGQNVYYCPECNERFTGRTKRALNRHRREEHPEEFAAEQEAPQAGPAPRTDRAPRTAPRLTRQLAEVRENVVLYYRLGGSTIGFRDPYCGGAIAQSSEQAADAWVKLAKDNKRVREFWSGGATSINWLGLFMAHLPILEAVREHHITPMMERRRMAAETEYDEGPHDDEPVVYTTVPEPASHIESYEGAFGTE